MLKLLNVLASCLFVSGFLTLSIERIVLSPQIIDDETISYRFCFRLKEPKYAKDCELGNNVEVYAYGMF
jgi:hypothetical protein